MEGTITPRSSLASYVFLLMDGFKDSQLSLFRQALGIAQIVDNVIDSSLDVFQSKSVIDAEHSERGNSNQNQNRIHWPSPRHLAMLIPTFTLLLWLSVVYLRKLKWEKQLKSLSRVGRTTDASNSPLFPTRKINIMTPNMGRSGVSQNPQQRMTDASNSSMHGTANAPSQGGKTNTGSVMVNEARSDNRINAQRSHEVVSPRLKPGVREGSSLSMSARKSVSDGECYLGPKEETIPDIREPSPSPIDDRNGAAREIDGTKTPKGRTLQRSLSGPFAFRPMRQKTTRNPSTTRSFRKCSLSKATPLSSEHCAPIFCLRTSRGHQRSAQRKLQRPDVASTTICHTKLQRTNYSPKNTKHVNGVRGNRLDNQGVAGIKQEGRLRATNTNKHRTAEISQLKNSGKCLSRSKLEQIMTSKRSRKAPTHRKQRQHVVVYNQDLETDRQTQAKVKTSKRAWQNCDKQQLRTRQGGRNLLIPVEDCKRNMRTSMPLALKDNNVNKNRRRINRKIGKCKVCNKFRVSAPASWEHRLFPRLNNTDCNSSIFQKVPICTPRSHCMERENCSKMGGLKKTDSLVLNSLAGKGAFYAYRNVSRLCSRNISKEEVNTNKSAAVNDKLVFMPNSNYRGKRKECKDSVKPKRKFSEGDRRLDKGQAKGTRDDKKTVRDLFLLKRNRFTPWSDAECIQSSKWRKDRLSHQLKGSETRLGDSAIGYNPKSEETLSDGGTPTGIQRRRHRSFSDFLNPCLNSSHELGDYTLGTMNANHAAEEFPQRSDLHVQKNTSEILLDNQLTRLNSLLQNANGHDRKSRQAKRLLTSFKLKLKPGSTNRTGSDVIKKESWESDSKDTSCMQKDYGEYYQFSNYNQVPQDKGGKSNCFCDPHHSTKIQSNYTIPNSDRRNRMHLMDKTNLFCKERASLTKPSFDIELSVSTCTSDSFYIDRAENKNCVRNSHGGESKLIGNYFNRETHSGEKEIPLYFTREHFQHNDIIRPTRNRWKLRHEPYKFPSHDPGLKETSVVDNGRNINRKISNFIYGQKPLLYAPQPTKEHRLTNNVALNDSFHDIYDTGWFTCNRDVAPKNKNNCSPLRKSHLDFKASIQEHQPGIANLHLDEISSSTGFDLDLKNSFVGCSQKPSTLEEPSAVSAYFSDGKRESKTRLLQNVFAGALQINGERQSDFDPAEKVPHTPNLATTFPETFLQNNKGLYPQSALHPEEVFDCQIQSPVRAFSPHLNSSIGFRMSSRSNALTDCGIQTSPQSVCVAVQTNLTMLSSRRKLCKTRIADFKHPSLRFACDGMAVSSWKRRLNRAISKHSSSKTASEPPSVTMKYARYTHKDHEQKNEVNVFVSNENASDTDRDTSINIQNPHQVVIDGAFDVSGAGDLINGVTDNPHSHGTPDLTSPINYQQKDITLSSKLSSPILASRQECVNNRPDSLNSTMKNYESDYSYVKTPKWCNVKIEEIDRRVKRALQLRQELRKARSNRSNPILNPEVDSLDGKCGTFQPLNQSSPITESPATFNLEISPRSVLCTSLNGSSQIELSTTSSAAQIPLATTPNTPPYSNRESPICQTQENLTKLTLIPNNEKISSHSMRSRSQSTTPSYCVKNCSSPHVGSTSGSTSTKLQKSRSFHFEASSTDDRVRQRTISDTLQDVNLKRNGSREKNSPPTKLSKMENMLSECPKLIAELVQKLPRVPLASFVEWYIETSNPGQTTTSRISPDSSDSRVETKESFDARAPTAQFELLLPEFKEGANYVEGRHSTHTIHGDFSGESPTVFRTMESTEENHHDKTKRNGEMNQRHSFPHDTSSHIGGQQQTSEISIVMDRGISNNNSRKTLGHQRQTDFGDNVRRTVIALRKSSDISGIVTKFSCHD